MAKRYKASQRQFALSCGLAAIACLGTWLTAVRFNEAWTARSEAHTSETILNGCQQLSVSLQHLEQRAARVIGAGTAADLMAYRTAQQTWSAQTKALWPGVRLDAKALDIFGDLVLTTQRWQDRTVEANLAGGPVSPLSPVLIQSAQDKLQQLIALEKTLYANRLASRTAPAKDFFIYGLGTLLLVALAAFGLRRDLMQGHFNPLDQLALSATDLLEGEGLVAPPTRGGVELAALARSVHQLGLRYMGLRSEQHHLHNLLGNLAELGQLRQTRPPATFYALFAEQVARQVEARSGAIAVMDGPLLRMVSQYGDVGSESLHLYMHDLLMAVQDAGDVVVWTESNQFPADLRTAMVDHRCHAVMAVPLWSQGTINGIVVVWHSAGRPWPQSQVAYLRAASGLIDFGEAAGVPTNTPVRGAIGERIAGARDLKQRQWALDQALTEALSPFNDAIGELLLLQPDGRTFAVAVARGLPAAEWDGSRCAAGDGLAGEAEAQGRWSAITDTSGAMHMLGNPYIRQWAPRAIALVPLPRLGSVRGVIAVYSHKEGAFDAAEAHMMAIASQIALGLQSAHGEAIAVEATHSWEAVADLSQAVQDSLTTTAVAMSWNDSIRETFSSLSSAIYLTTDTGHLQLAASHGKAPERLNGDACHAVVSGKVCGSDGAICHACTHNAAPGHLCLPLQWQGRTIGTATVQGPTATYWTPARTRLATVMTDLVTFGVITVRATQRENHL
ncbi:MAG: GAF domain-containing protein [Candidatus Sericytochromatia bacterium]|nr:GAF domain-containing protein [Candidatus Sericytochromatia bacterium]